MPRHSSALALAEPLDSRSGSVTPDREALIAALARGADIEVQIADEHSGQHEARRRESDQWSAVCKASGDEFHARASEQNIAPWTLNEAQARILSDRRSSVPLPLDQAKEIHSEAQKEHARIEREIDWRASNIRTLEAHLSLAQRNITNAANCALVSDPAFHGLMKEASRRARAFHDLAATINMLHEQGIASAATKGWDDRPTRESCNYPVLTAWYDALQRLKTDPATTLPRADAS